MASFAPWNLSTDNSAFRLDNEIGGMSNVSANFSRQQPLFNNNNMSNPINTTKKSNYIITDSEKDSSSAQVPDRITTPRTHRKKAASTNKRKTSLNNILSPQVTDAQLRYSFPDFSSAYDDVNSSPTRKSNVESRLGPTPGQSTNANLGNTLRHYNIPEFSQKLNNFIIDSDSSDAFGGISPISQKAMGNSVNSRPNTNESAKAGPFSTNVGSLPTSFAQKENNNTGYVSNADTIRNGINLGYKIPEVNRPYNNNDDPNNNSSEKVSSSGEPRYTQSQNYPNYNQDQYNNQQEFATKPTTAKRDSTKYKKTRNPDIGLPQIPITSAFSTSDDGANKIQPTRGAKEYHPLKAMADLENINDPINPVTLEYAFKDLRVETSKAENENKTLRDRLNQVERTLTKVMAERDELEAMYSNLEKRHGDYTQTINNLNDNDKKHISSLHDKITTLEANLENKARKYDTAKVKNRNLAGLHEDLEKQFHLKDQELTVLKSKLSALQLENGYLKTELENARQGKQPAPVPGLESELSKLQTQLDELKLKSQQEQSLLQPLSQSEFQTSQQQAPPPTNSTQLPPREVPNPSVTPASVGLSSSIKESVDTLEREFSRIKNTILGIGNLQETLNPTPLSTNGPTSATSSVPISVPTPAPTQTSIPVSAPSITPISQPTPQVPVQQTNAQNPVDKSIYDLAVKLAEIISLQQTINEPKPSTPPATASENKESSAEKTPTAEPDAPKPKDSSMENILERLVNVLERRSSNKPIDSRPTSAASRVTIQTPKDSSPAPILRNESQTRSPSDSATVINDENDISNTTEETFTESMNEEFITIPLSLYKEQQRMLRRASNGRSQQQQQPPAPAPTSVPASAPASAPAPVSTSIPIPTTATPAQFQSYPQSQPLYQYPVPLTPSSQPVYQQPPFQPQYQQPAAQFQPRAPSQQQFQQVPENKPFFQKQPPPMQQVNPLVQNTVLPWSEIGKGPHAPNCDCNLCKSGTRPSSSPLKNLHEKVNTRNTHTEDDHWEEESTPRPTTSAEEALRTVLNQLEEEYDQLNNKFKQLTTSFGEGDPAVRKRQRDRIAERILVVTKEIQSKADQIYALHDVNFAAHLNVDSTNPTAEESRKSTGILPTLYGDANPSPAPKNTKRASSHSRSRPPSIYKPYVPSENYEDSDGDDALDSDLNTTEITGKYVWKA